MHTGRSSMHISVHVRSGDPKTDERELTTHCMMIFVALDDDRAVGAVRQWVPVSEEDVALDAHARHLDRAAGSARTCWTGSCPAPRRSDVAVPATRCAGPLPGEQGGRA